MHVELLYHTPDPERAIATAARLCYAPVGAAELMETMPPERIKSVLTTIMSSGHFSTLEHASYTFAVDGVSRALTHQLVRHRIASFNQQSQRYVKFAGDVAVVKPESIAGNAEASEAFDKAIQAAVDAYHALLDAVEPFLQGLIHGGASFALFFSIVRGNGGNVKMAENGETEYELLFENNTCRI